MQTSCLNLFSQSSFAYMQRTLSQFLLTILLSLIATFFVTTPLFSAEENTDSDLKTRPGPPPGFENLVNPQNYFG